jgi:hypothetical protein
MECLSPTIQEKGVADELDAKNTLVAHVEEGDESVEGDDVDFSIGGDFSGHSPVRPEESNDVESLDQKYVHRDKSDNESGGRVSWNSHQLKNQVLYPDFTKELMEVDISTCTVEEDVLENGVKEESEEKSSTEEDEESDEEKEKWHVSARRESKHSTIFLIQNLRKISRVIEDVIPIASKASMLASWKKT